MSKRKQPILMLERGNMYSKIFEGRKIRITNYHHKMLLERFNSANFKYKEGEPHHSGALLMKNNVACSLCKSYSKRRRGALNCSKCPLERFAHNILGCTQLGCNYILRKLAPTSCVCVFIGSASYWYANKKTALRELKAITNFLKSFKKE